LSDNKHYIKLHKLLEMSRDNAHSHRILIVCNGEYSSDRQRCLVCKKTILNLRGCNLQTFMRNNSYFQILNKNYQFLQPNIRNSEPQFSRFSWQAGVFSVSIPT